MCNIHEVYKCSMCKIYACNICKYVSVHFKTLCDLGIDGVYEN